MSLKDNGQRLPYFGSLNLGWIVCMLTLVGCGGSDSGPKSLESVTNSIGMEMLIVPGGKFQMGSRRGDVRELPVHEVTISKPFGLGRTEVTEEQYQAVMGKQPKLSKPDCAVDSLTWAQASEFCKRLSNLPAEKAAGRSYRLPTEAEWEYACRAGTSTAYSFGDDATKVTDHAWYSRNGLQEAHPPGGKIANPWGFSDMHGNAWEWCHNWLYDYTEDPVTDPAGPETGKERVLRGGAWFHREPDCRSSTRAFIDPKGDKQYLGGLRVTLLNP